MRTSGTTKKTRRSHRQAGRAHVAGATLIEVMVAVLILAIGLLGIAAMQAAALRNSQSALERSQGVINTYAIIDAMRANVEHARSGSYNIGKTCDATVTNTGLAGSDIQFWLSKLHQNLGADACGEIACTGSRCDVKVTWNDTRGSGGVDDLTFHTEVVL